MRVTSLDFASAPALGLKPFVMRPLGPMVVLAGPNGAGKTRILRTLKKRLVDPHRENVHTFRAALDEHRRHLERSKTGLLSESVRRSYNEIVETAESVTVEGNFSANSVFDTFPKATSLVDHRNLVEAAQEAAEQRLNAGPSGLESLAKDALAYVARVMRRWFAATHGEISVASEIKERATADRERLCKLVLDLLGTKLELNLDQQPALFGSPISDASLSDGQIILLQIAVALHAQESRLDGLIITLDEPESHLHPAAIIHAIERLKAANKNGQLWIATHCVPVLSAMPSESIWFVNEGGASWAGRSPEIVLEGLLGGPKGRERVEDFLRLPAQLAASQFAAECLIPPRAVVTGPDDPQSLQVRDFCKASAVDRDEPIKVLDFGAGQGRLLSAMSERWGEDASFTKRVDYRAFEPFPDEGKRLERTVQSVYGNDGVRRVIDREDKLALLDEHSVDIVVMCNVLHEVPPERWPVFFGRDGLLQRLLTPAGRLLILEDMEIPHGEMAHRFGFLLLDHQHIYKLFSVTEQDEQIQTTSVRADRLKAHAVPAALMGRTTKESTRVALELLRSTALHEIAGIRRSDVGSRDGRKHALWTQLLANADLGLEAF